MALNNANCGSERHDSWFGAAACTRTTPGSLGSQYSNTNPPRLRHTRTTREWPCFQLKEVALFSVGVNTWSPTLRFELPWR